MFRRHGGRCKCFGVMVDVVNAVVVVCYDPV